MASTDPRYLDATDADIVYDLHVYIEMEKRNAEDQKRRFEDRIKKGLACANCKATFQTSPESGVCPSCGSPVISDIPDDVKKYLEDAGISEEEFRGDAGGVDLASFMGREY